MRPVLTLLFALMTLAHGPYAAATSAPQARVLVFSKTAGWRHDSIPTAVATLQRLGAQQGMQVDHTEDATWFKSARLARYQVVVFANTTLDVLDEAQQLALESFVRGGGGFMGVHSAADTEHDWPWFGQLVGARFANHPPGVQTSRVVAEYNDVATGETWSVTEAGTPAWATKLACARKLASSNYSHGLRSIAELVDVYWDRVESADTQLTASPPNFLRERETTGGT